MPAIRKKKTKLKGITYPWLATPDTGITVVRQISQSGDRLKLWYLVDGKRRYVTLPKGTTMDEARTRRDHLYRNLKELHQARQVKVRTITVKRKPSDTQLTPEKYIYRRAPYLVRVLGKVVGEAETREQAVRVRNQWLRANKTLVPQLANAIANL